MVVTKFDYEWVHLKHLEWGPGIQYAINISSIYIISKYK